MLEALSPFGMEIRPLELIHHCPLNEQIFLSMLLRDLLLIACKCT